ncbi:hypothetical protein K438DRAFT_1610724, partial [Mycena galopus ATCC 62051]
TIVGVLDTGCTLSTIVSCYQMYFTSDPTEMLDPGFPTSPRQRDEFHFPELAAGTAFSYTWKQYLYASTGTSSSFFHIMQAFSESDGEPLVTLDAVNGDLSIKDYVRGDGEASCGAATCPTTDLANYHGKTTTHTISGKFGPTGSLSYKVTNDNAGGIEIISYSVTGNMGSGSGYIKFGIYRAAFDGMTTANAIVGDWVIN